MKNFKTIVEYDGTDFYGWQIQPGKRTVQGEIINAIKKIYDNDVKLFYASRTDRGVHSKGQLLKFSISHDILPDNAENTINKYFNGEIVLRKTDVCREDFNPRYHNKGKLYTYRIANKIIPEYMMSRYSWYINENIDWNVVEKGLSYVKGKHDFRCLSSPENKEKSTIINIERAELEREGELYCIKYKAKYFLTYMIRFITGFIIQCGRNREDIEKLKNLLCGEDKSPSFCAPAKGLELTKVYEEE